MEKPLRPLRERLMDHRKFIIGLRKSIKLWIALPLTVLLVSASARAQLPRFLFMLGFSPRFTEKLCDAGSGLFTRCFLMESAACSEESEALTSQCAESLPDDVPGVLLLWKLEDAGRAIGTCVGDRFLTNHLALFKPNTNCGREFEGHARHVPDSAFDEQLSKIAEHDELVKALLGLYPNRRSDIAAMLRRLRRGEPEGQKARQALIKEALGSRDPNALDSELSLPLLEALADVMDLLAKHPKILSLGFLASSELDPSSPEAKQLAEKIFKNDLGLADQLTEVKEHVLVNGLRYLSSQSTQPPSTAQKLSEEKIFERVMNLSEPLISKTFSPEEEGRLEELDAAEDETPDEKDLSLIYRRLALYIRSAQQLVPEERAQMATFFWKSSQMF